MELQAKEDLQVDLAVPREVMDTNLVLHTVHQVVEMAKDQDTTEVLLVDDQVQVMVLLVVEMVMVNQVHLTALQVTWDKDHHRHHMVHQDKEDKGVVMVGVMKEVM